MNIPRHTTFPMQVTLLALLLQAGAATAATTPAPPRSPLRPSRPRTTAPASSTPR